MKLACGEHGGTLVTGTVGAEHTLIGIAAPSPIRAPPTAPLNKVTGSTIRREWLDPAHHRGAGTLHPKGCERIGPFELSIAILNHTADRRLVLLNNCGHWPPFEKPAEWSAQPLALLRGIEKASKPKQARKWLYQANARATFQTAVSSPSNATIL